MHLEDTKIVTPKEAELLRSGKYELVSLGRGPNAYWIFEKGWRKRLK